MAEIATRRVSEEARLDGEDPNGSAAVIDPRRLKQTWDDDAKQSNRDVLEVLKKQL